MKDVLRLVLAACLALAMAGPATAQERPLEELVPEGPYGIVLLAALKKGRFDFDALRAAYAADPGYDGQARMKDFAAEAMLAKSSGQPAPARSMDDVLAAIFEDFPLADTQLLAFLHFNDMGKPGEKMRESHRAFYREVIDTILATRTEVAGAPTYKVLSVGEEYEVLRALGAKPRGQSLVDIGGQPFDCHETDAGRMCFDISAFFGR